MLAGMNVPSNLDVPAHSANAITIWYTTHISQLKQTVQHVVWQTKMLCCVRHGEHSESFGRKKTGYE